MGIKEFLGIYPSEKDPRDNHTFTDEERAAARQTRAAKSELMKRKHELDVQKMELQAERSRLQIEWDIERMKNQIAEMRGEYDDYDEPQSQGIEDQLLTHLLTRVGTNSPAAAAAPVPVPVQQTQTQLPTLDITEERIIEFWKSVDRTTKKLVKKMSDEELSSVIKGKIPNISQQSLNTAINVIRR